MVTSLSSRSNSRNSHRDQRPSTASSAPPSSASSLRSRNLSNYPMDHSHQETLTAMSTRRKALDQHKMVSRKVGLLSANLSRQSKMLFEGALQGVGRPQIASSHQSLPEVTNKRCGGHFTDSIPSYGWRQSESRGSSATSSTRNGPTLQGSIMYSNRPVFMTDAGVSDMDLPLLINQPRHLTLTPEIQDTLRRSNTAYRVVSCPIAGTISNGSSRCSPSFQDYLLVPARSGSGDDLTLDEALSFGDPDETSTMIDSARRKTRQITQAVSDISFETQSDLTENANLDSATTEECPEKKNDEETTVPQEDIKEDKPDSQGHCADKRRRRVTWVDDATVSSPTHVTCDEGALALETRDSSNEQQQQQQQQNLGTGTLQPEVLPRHEVTIGDGEHVAHLSELQDSVVSLPDFICPSSEDKSREARTRHWLKSNSFTWASRSLPLL